TTDQGGADVVEERRQRRQGGQQDHVDDADDHRQGDHPAEAEVVHEVEAARAVLARVQHDDELVDRGEDLHPGQDAPQHGDHDDAGDAEGHRHQERDLHDRPRVDPLQRQPDPPRTRAPRRAGARGTRCRRGTRAGPRPCGRGRGRGTGRRSGPGARGTRDPGTAFQVAPRGGPGHGAVAHRGALTRLRAGSGDPLGGVGVDGRVTVGRAHRSSPCGLSHHSPAGSPESDPSDGTPSVGVGAACDSGSRTICSISSSSEELVARVIATMASPGPGLANFTPAVSRPVTRTWSIGERTTLPRSMTTRTWSPGSTVTAPTRSPPFSVCRATLMPSPPRPWTRYAEAGVRLARPDSKTTKT